ncbi:MAG: terminase family protein [Armatimonadota bacterium]|nr:terminase family protein [Armatimonadota bacterium]
MDRFLQALANANWMPHAGQLAYLKSKARFRVLACGRRWGKTDAAAAEIAARISTLDNSRQIAIAPTVTQAKIVFDRVKWMLGAAGVLFSQSVTPFPSLRVVDSDKEIVLHVLDARSGHEAKNLRGQGADHILMDEAAFMPESLIAEVAMPMLAATNGRMTLISTPFGRNHFYRYFQMGERDENEFWSRSGPSSENPMVDWGFLAAQKSLLTEAAYKTEYESEFLDSSCAVFAYEAIQAALSAPSVDRGATFVGVDWARYRDFTAVAAVRGTQLRAEVIACDAWNGLRWSATINRALEFAKLHGAAVINCDKTGLGDPVTDQLRENSPKMVIGGEVFTNQTKAAMVQNLVWMLENERLRLPPDADLLRELDSFEATVNASTIRYAAGMGHDDRVCALALACIALPNGRPVKIIGKERK